MTEKQHKYSMLNRVVLAHIFMWLDQHVKNKEIAMPDICYKLKAAGYASKIINGFSEEEIKFLLKLGKDEEFMEMARTPVSLVVMALEVIKYHVTTVSPELRTPKLNISDKKLMVGKAAYWKFMVNEKKKNQEDYEHQKEVIDDTVKQAVVFYDALFSAIMEHKFKGY